MELEINSNKEKVLVTKASLPKYEEYVEKIRLLWETNYITNMGLFHNQLELRLRDYLDVNYLSLFVNGHMALELCIQAFDFPEGSEIITTPYTFISTTHAIIRNHLKPIFCDIKPTDYTIDENKIEDLISNKTVAILPVHVYGNICNVDAIQRVAEKHNLKVIYDAAHAFGEKLNNIAIGNFGDASIFSFHATKVFNTIEGGAVTFHNIELYEKLYYLKNFGIKNEEIVSDIGANAKMNEFSAAMGLCNLDHITDYINSRKKCVELYKYLLKDCVGLRFLDIRRGILQNYSYFPIFINERLFGISRDELQKRLQEENIYSRKYFWPITADTECFKGKYAYVPLVVARETSREVLSLPLFSDMDESTVLQICEIILNAQRRK